MFNSVRLGRIFLAALIYAAFWGSASTLAADSEFPEMRPTTRAAAARLLMGPVDADGACLTPNLQERHGSSPGVSPAERRGLALLERRIQSTDEPREISTPDGVLIRYTTNPRALDRLRFHAGERRPQAVDATILGLDQARRLLVDRLELPAPRSLEVLLAELGPLDGYFLPADRRGTRGRIVLDTNPTEGVQATRRGAVHQYAHAVIAEIATDFPPRWAEAFATWTVLAVDGNADPRSVERFNHRLSALDRGLLDSEDGLDIGNALWFAFLENAYGIAAVRTTVEELARGGATSSALDHGVRRATNDDLSAAFREFHLWSVLVGRRSNGQHFSFANRLRMPEFASVGDGLPALSVQSDAPLSDLGATQVLLKPELGKGGVNLHFEGTFSGRWEADLLLVGRRGELRRLSLDLTPDGRGEITLPLHDLAEALILIRNLGSDDGTPQHYTYAAHAEPSFPFEIDRFDAVPVDRGVALTWSTASEQSLIGFNLLRTREGSEEPVIVNPVWIPALGSDALATSYRFFDRSAERGVSYTYRVEGITEDGLTAPSEPVPLTRPTTPSR